MRVRLSIAMVAFTRARLAAFEIALLAAGVAGACGPVRARAARPEKQPRASSDSAPVPTAGSTSRTATLRFPYESLVLAKASRDPTPT